MWLHGESAELYFRTYARSPGELVGGACGGIQKKEKDEVGVEETGMEDGDYAENVAPQHSDEKKKKKRKRKQVLDLRFEAEALEQSGGRLKRKERKKKYLEAKKNKNKKGKKEDNVGNDECSSRTPEHEYKGSSRIG